MVSWVLMAWLALAKANPCASQPPRSATATQVFDHARGLFLSGCHQQALAQFEQLSHGTVGGVPTPPELVAEALVFSGEISYIIGNRTEALQAIEAVLDRAPNYRIGVLDHDPNFVDFFRLIQQSRAALPPPKPPPLPWQGYMPFGVPQFHQRRKAAGAGWLIGQSLTAGTSIGLFIALQYTNENPSEASELNRTQIMRGFQWGSTGAFYLLWLGSHLEARSWWRRQSHPLPSMGVSVSPAGTPLGTVSGRF